MVDNIIEKFNLQLENNHLADNYQIFNYPIMKQSKMFTNNQYLMRAGMRNQKITIDRVGIVVCGGLCPGLNNVI